MVNEYRLEVKEKWPIECERLKRFNLFVIVMCFGEISVLESLLKVQSQ